MVNLFFSFKMIPVTLKRIVSIFTFSIIATFIDISTSVTIKNIYKLAKINDTYDSYMQWTQLEKNTDSYHYEKTFDEQLFFEIMHNLHAMRIPKITDVQFNYKLYSTNYDNYCNTEYSSYDFFVRKNKLEDFKKGAKKLIDCLNNEEPNTSPKLTTKLYNCLDQECTGCNFCGLINFESRKNSMKKNQSIKCLIKDLLPDQKNILNSCMDDFHVHVPVIDAKTTKNPSQKAGKNNSTLPEDTNLKQLRIKDLNLLKDLIGKGSKILDDNTTLSSMFRDYTKHPIVSDQNQHIANCLYYKMNVKMYTATQMMYKILPSPTDENIDLFRTKLLQIVAHLEKMDPSYFNRELLYVYLKKKNGLIDQKHFEKLKNSRRAMKHESDYKVYAMRLLMKGYMPLSTELWKEERKNLAKYETDIVTEEKHIEL